MNQLRFGEVTDICVIVTDISSKVADILAIAADISKKVADIRRGHALCWTLDPPQVYP